jgi:low density lipoprotein receptor-related protein 5/6
MRLFALFSWHRVVLVGVITGCLTVVACDSFTNFFINNDQYSHGLGVPFTVKQIYWADKFKQGFAPSGQIERADMDGKNETLLVPGLQEPDGLALDLVFRKIYWTDHKAGVIQRADLSGKNVETLVPFQIQGSPAPPPLKGPAGLAIDFPRARMYWTEVDGGTITRADYRDGSSAQVVLSNLGGPNSIALALDVKAYSDVRRMFWTETVAGKIKRADLDGNNIQELLPNLKSPQGLALNLVAGKMFWVEGSEIHQANLDGSNNTVFSNLNINLPYYIALDVAGGHMFWTLAKGQAISNEDPNFAKSLIITNIQGTPAGIAVGIK